MYRRANVDQPSAHPFQSIINRRRGVLWRQSLRHFVPKVAGPSEIVAFFYSVTHVAVGGGGQLVRCFPPNLKTTLTVFYNIPVSSLAVKPFQLGWNRKPFMLKRPTNDATESGKPKETAWAEAAVTSSGVTYICEDRGARPFGTWAIMFLYDFRLFVDRSKSIAMTIGRCSEELHSLVSPVQTFTSRTLLTMLCTGWQISSAFPSCFFIRTVICGTNYRGQLISILEGHIMCNC